MNFFRALPGAAFLALSFTSFSAAQASEVAERKPYVMARTEERMMRAADGREYRIMISWPEAKAPAAGYPVTYVLDGDDLFPVVTAILRVQAGTEKMSLHNAISPGVVVAIGYPGKTGRNIDYTPDAPKDGPPETYVNGKPYPPQESGGADAFYGFVEKELKPAIEKDYPIDRTQQSLLGNGYGGLFALHVLFTRPESYQTYIASSPSVWWNNRYIIQEEKNFTKKVATEPIKARLVITAGELEQSLTQHEYSWADGPREEHALKTARRRMVDNTREMYWRLLELAPKGLDTTYRIFPMESHKSVVPVAVSHALPFVFPPAAAESEKTKARGEEALHVK